MIGRISTIGMVIDTVAMIFIIVKLYRPTKEGGGFNPTTFRGSLFWFYVLFATFTGVMASTAYFNDERTAGLYSYTIGHVFLYLAMAVYIYAPFSITRPGKRKIPNILAALIVLSSMIINYVTWNAFDSGDHIPVVGDNEVIIWSPPNIVFVYILVTLIFTIGYFGVFFFWNHARKTADPFVRKRSFLLGLGFLTIIISGPPHDFEGIAPGIILAADALVAVGFLLQGYALSLKPPKT